MASSSGAAGALLGDVRVLSLGTFVAGNVCALLLAELGADVVKVEARARPEALRAYPSPDHAALFEPGGTPTTALFAGLTRGMRSISIDTNAPEGRHTLRALASHADVLIENLGGQKLEALGCSFAQLRETSPNIVLLSISGYGASGPMAGYRAYASNINNFVGLTLAWALDGTHFDVVAGIDGATAVVAALTAVANGAPGVAIDLAQTEAGAALMAPLYLDFLANGRDWAAAPNEVPGALFSGVLRCEGADAWVAIELEDAQDWQVLCSYLERVDLCVDDEHSTPEQREALCAAIEEWTRELTPFQVAHRLQRLGLAVAPVQNSEDLWRDTQHRSRHAFCEIVHPDIGRLEYPRSASRLSKTLGPVGSRGPRLGEHTTAVLEEWLRLDEDAIDDLRHTGAIWQP